MRRRWLPWWLVPAPLTSLALASLAAAAALVVLMATTSTGCPQRGTYSECTEVCGDLGRICRDAAQAAQATDQVDEAAARVGAAVRCMDSYALCRKGCSAN